VCNPLWPHDAPRSARRSWKPPSASSIRSFAATQRSRCRETLSSRHPRGRLLLCA
jgi:hypothetical protein